MWTGMNLVRIVVASLAGLVIGFVWYLPREPLFGLRWAGLVKRWTAQTDAELMANQGQKVAAWFVTALVNAFVLAYVLQQLAPIGVGSAILVGIVLWLGLGLTFSAWQVIFAKQPRAIWLINNGAFLLMQVVMAAILAVWTV
jgi:hypothetical protein